MNIFLRLHLDCTPDAAWAAIANPAVFKKVSAPWMRILPVEKKGFPQKWTGDGPHEVKLFLLGVIPLGTQTIDISFTERPGDVRMMIDSGKPTSGPMTMVTTWDHRMAISPLEDGTTLYRDRLVFSAGLLTPLMFLGLWTFWQLRGAKLKKLARSWS